MTLARRLQPMANVEVQGLDLLNYNKTNLPMHTYDGSQFPFPDNHFDAVLLCFVLHHSKNHEGMLQEAVGIQRPNHCAGRPLPNMDGTAAHQIHDIIVNKLICTDVAVRVPSEQKKVGEPFSQLDLSVDRIQLSVATRQCPSTAVVSPEGEQRLTIPSRFALPELERPSLNLLGLSPWAAQTIAAVIWIRIKHHIPSIVCNEGSKLTESLLLACGPP